MFGAASAEDAGILLYDGEELARRTQSIVITVQYRLNIFGFAVDGALDTESPTSTSGNYGLRDQLAALVWIQRNVAAFGGDQTRVLLFGESGGATDVCALLAAPLAKGLFSSPLIQSGGCGGKARAAVRTWTDGAFAAAGCPRGANRLDFIRSLEGSALVRAISTQTTATGVITTPAGPTIGDDYRGRGSGLLELVLQLDG
jgi:para-nitrobenzyl esterase